jgi:D-alanyl-D-alanine carboxypeptidase (penicillin-binding protein 5/6)
MKPLALVFIFLIVGSLGRVDAAASAAPPDINAQSFLLMDFDSGSVLLEKGGDERIDPASLTKIMTAYVVDAEIKAGKLKPDDKVTISDHAWRMGGVHMFARSGAQVGVDELLKSVIVQSGNDAAVALAEHIGGSEIAFAALMNQYAQRLGMTHSHFTNSTGLPDPNHFMTARDLATLARAAIRDFPDSYVWYSAKEYSYGGITQYSRNKLLWTDPTVDGLKTGFTDGAGFGLVASAKKNGMRLISVILGSNSENARADESLRLLNYGFSAFETHRLYAGQQQLAEAVIWKGEKKKLSLGLMSDLYITIPRGQYKNLNAALDMRKRIVAPADKGQNFGSVTVKLGDRVYAEQTLVSLEPVAPGGFVNNAVDDMKLLFQ